jgi:hypothetical protein
MDTKAAVPIYLKMARYKPNETKRGNEKAVATRKVIHC